MKLAIIGSRSLDTEIPEDIMPKNVTEIISGGAIGIDKSAKKFALKNNIKILEILPDYELFGKRAPLIRNDSIINKADMVYVFWDGNSRGSGYVIRKCLEIQKPLKVFKWQGSYYTECSLEDFI